MRVLRKKSQAQGRGKEKEWKRDCKPESRWIPKEQASRRRQKKKKKTEKKEGVGYSAYTQQEGGRMFSRPSPGGGSSDRAHARINPPRQAIPELQQGEKHPRHRNYLLCLTRSSGKPYHVERGGGPEKPRQKDGHD